MYDTPGIIQSHQMTHYVSEKELKTIVPKNEIKQRVFNLMKDKRYSLVDCLELIMFQVEKDR